LKDPDLNGSIMMVFTLLLALAKNCWCCNGKSRRLSLAQIAGYEPWTVVTDAVRMMLPTLPFR
jgi:hypothetical protein